MPLSLPFASNLLVGLAGVNIRKDLASQLGSEPDLIKLALERLSYYWGIGKLLLGRTLDVAPLIWLLLTIVIDVFLSHENGPPEATSEPISLDKGLVRRLAALMPEKFEP